MREKIGVCRIWKSWEAPEAMVSSRRKSWDPRVALAVLLASSLAESLTGQAPRSQRVRSEITSQLERSVDRGLQHLIDRQKPSGSFSNRYQVAVNALVGMAFLAGGHTNRLGPHTEVVQETLEGLLTYQRADGYFTEGGSDQRRLSRMYGHGFATLFLAELYGMTGRQNKRVRESLVRAVRVIEGSQCADGGWDYYPSKAHQPAIGLFSQPYSGIGDTSITVCQTMALRASRNLGLQVDPKVIARARRFIEKAQNGDGGFAYKRLPLAGILLRPVVEASEFPRSAAGVCILASLGDYNSEKIRRGYDYLMDHYHESSLFPYYAYYYCSQAMFQAGGRYWRQYFPYVRGELLRKQRRDGSWEGRVDESAQSTAMALIVLQIPYRFLPIFER